MTLRSRLLAFFPLLVMSGAMGLAVWFVVVPSIGHLLGLLVWLYAFPLLCFKVHAYFYPLEPGISRLDTGEYSSWWGGHQIQLVYIAFPILETALRLIPGAFSFWLRLWGSRIGKQVYWTPSVRIEDRSLVVVGDGVIFGHKVECYSHIVRHRRKKILLYVCPVEIGDGAFVGAGCRMGPGTKIAAGSQVPLLTTLRVNARAL